MEFVVVTTEKTIVVKNDLSEFPGGRFKVHGEFSGELFRDEHLVPALKNFERVVVVLDGTAGYAGSFLEEAFGGLVRERGFTAAELHKRLEIRASDLSFQVFRRLAWQYIDDADKTKIKSKSKVA